MQPKTDKGIIRILERLEMAHFESYAVGRVVRDILLDRPLHSIEIITSAGVEQIKKLFHKTSNSDLKSSSVTVIIDGTGYRVISCGDKENRLKSYDFTMNAVAYSHIRGFYDCVGGEDDIKNHIIRCIGNPELSIANDPIRLLRALRYSITLGFDIDTETQAAIKKHAPMIKKVRPERIREELNKILLSDTPERFVMLHDFGLMKYILPELEKCFDTPQKNKYHIYNVGMHIMKALEGLPKDLTVCWAVLLHDVGKPNCSSTDSNGIIHFYGHHRESRKIAVDILHRLHFDNDIIQSVSVLVNSHDVRIDPVPSSVKRMLAKIGADMFDKLMIVQEADSRAKNEKYINEKLSRINNVRAVFKNIIAEHQPYSIDSLAVTNQDLTKLGFKAGRECYDILKLLLEDVIITPENNNRKYLLKKAGLLRKKKGNNK